MSLSDKIKIRKVVCGCNNPSHNYNVETIEFKDVKEAIKQLNTIILPILVQHKETQAIEEVYNILGGKLA
jgi:hypothetical protein